MATARALALVLLLSALRSADAAWPMATDDTATAPAGECQIEAWSTREDSVRSITFAPACGLTDSLELGTAASRVQGGEGSTVDGAALGLKWVPAAAAWDTAVGEVRMGLLGGVTWARTELGGWHSESAVLAGLGSLQFAPAWTLYVNVFAARNLDLSRWTSGWRSALAWQPDERLLLFVETLRASDSSNVRNAGWRLWLLPEILGLDVVITRSRSGTAFGLGFGWYGIFGP